MLLTLMMILSPVFSNSKARALARQLHPQVFRRKEAEQAGAGQMELICRNPPSIFPSVDMDQVAWHRRLRVCFCHRCAPFRTVSNGRYAMRSNLNKLVGFVLAALIVLAPTRLALAGEREEFVVFGDSLSDPGKTFVGLWRLGTPPLVTVPPSPTLIPPCPYPPPPLPFTHRPPP